MSPAPTNPAMVKLLPWLEETKEIETCGKTPAVGEEIESSNGSGRLCNDYNRITGDTLGHTSE
eukprot:766720-Hanusia_phi.AAC.4